MQPYRREHSTHVTDPSQVRSSREKKIEGDRLPDENARIRPFFCRSCGTETRSVLVPRGWYQLTRATGSVTERPHRLGLYCSLRCLDEQMPRLFGIEIDLGETFTESASEFRQRGTR